MRPTLATLAVVWLLSGVAVAGQFGCPTCQTCGGTCVVKASPVVEKETCYEVECEAVCIPAIRFPWDSCHEPKCGRVRQVSVLKKESRETTVCKYEWIVVCPHCGPMGNTSGATRNIPPAPEAARPNATGPNTVPVPPAAPPVTRMFPAARSPHNVPTPPTDDQAFRLVGAESSVSSTR